TQRFQSRTNAPRFPLGDIVSGAPLALVGPRPAPRPPWNAAGARPASAAMAMPAHWVAMASHLARARFAGSMTMTSSPASVVLRYQNRPSLVQFGDNDPTTTSPARLGPRKRFARS